MPFILAILAALLSFPVLGGPTNAHARVRLQPVERVRHASVVDVGMDASVAKADRVRPPALPPVRPVAAMTANVARAAPPAVPGVTARGTPVLFAAPPVPASVSGAEAVAFRHVFLSEDLDLLCPALAGKRAADDSWFGIRARRIVGLARAGKLDEAKAEAERYAADWGLYRERGGHR